MTADRPKGAIEVSELRERLRALGYLNAGVDRFVLAPAQAGRSAVGLAWRVSARIGMLAALLLGPAAAVGVAIRLPGLITGARDALVISIYLAIVFGGAAALASFGAALLVRGLSKSADARTVRRLGIGAGWLVGIGCLAYLTLWWNATGFAWSAPARTLIAIAAAVAVSLLLGHAITVAVLALAAGDQQGQDLPAPVLSWRTSLAVAALAFLGATGALAISLVRGGDPRSTAAPIFPVVPTGLRVVVVGIDGFDPQLQHQLRDQLPVISRLMRRSDGATDGRDGDPARVWTTVGTGMRSPRHGVSGLAPRRVAGIGGAVEEGEPTRLFSALATASDLLRLTRPAPVSGVMRREKMFWEVAAEHGLDATVVNWWATWPAVNTRAIVISDRAPLRLERGGPQAHEIAPAEIYEPLRRRWPSIDARARAMAVSLGSQVADPGIRDILERSARLDAQQALIARDPLLGTPDLLAVYLPGLDIAQYELLHGRAERPLSASALGSRLESIRRYYVFLDGLVGQLVSGESVDVVGLVTHPGRLGQTASPFVEFSGVPIDPSVGRDFEGSQAASLTDVAPTVLYLLGLPVSRELPGRADHWPLKPDFVSKHPLRFVETYGAYAAAAPSSEGAPLDRETLDRLRSLGYIR